MTIPLYTEHQSPNTAPEGGHLGLWYTRFFNRYDADWKLDDTAKSEWINSVANKTCGNSEKLTQHAERTITLIKALKGQHAICDTNWHFVTGLGLPHPVENGFTWHQTLGVPFLAGSAIKGVLRAWVEQWDDTDRAQRLKDWFGLDKKEAEKQGTVEQAGKLIFFDAIPIDPVKLSADIMTPHYGDWYAKGQENQGVNPEHVPADWHDPVPVPFLVAKRASFLMGIAARDIKNEDMAQKALEVLIEAVQWLGVGAKTAAGYGHLEKNEKAEQYLEGEMKKKIPVEKPVDPLELLKELEAGTLKDNPTKQKEQAEYIKKLMKVNDKWREINNAKNQKKKNTKFERTKRVMKFL